MMLSQKSLSSEFSLALTRREVLRVGAASLILPCFNSFAPTASAVTPVSSAFSSAKTVILLWMDGGLPHLDTFDPKSCADSAIRGPFGAVKTRADGIQISDRLPRLASCADSFIILRGISHGEGGHERAAHLVLTGYPLISTEISYHFGAVLAQNRGAAPPVFSFAPPRAVIERQSEINYGDTAFGRACLAARRQAEIGVPFVQVSLANWDLHQHHFSRLQYELLPALDAGLSALLIDLRQRGLLESTLVVCMGEFGRSPRINANRFPGRDHWPAAACVLLAGGGIRGGQILGATDSEGMAPLESSLSPQDVLATIYHLAGISAPSVSISIEAGRVLHEICR